MDSGPELSAVTIIASEPTYTTSVARLSASATRMLVSVVSTASDSTVRAVRSVRHNADSVSS